jgi:hypothetical protein
MNKVIFSDFTLQNSQLFKWRYMSSIWVRTKSYLWGNNGEQPEATWPEETLSGTGSMRMRNRKFYNAPSGAFSPEVTGSDRVRNRYILYYYQSSITSTMVTCDRRSPEGVERAFLPEVGYRKWSHFPPRIFLSSTKCWLGVLYDVRVYPFPWLSAPFIFIITYKVCCFRICCVVLQGWCF